MCCPTNANSCFYLFDDVAERRFPKRLALLAICASEDRQRLGGGALKEDKMWRCTITLAAVGALTAIAAFE